MNDNLPVAFREHYNDFEAWHLDKRDQLLSKGDEAYAFLEASFPAWEKEYREEIRKMGMLTMGLDEDIKQAIKDYIKTSQLYKAYLKTPYYRQIITKPRGYAGDADMMKIIYRNEFEGDDVFSKLIHRLATECDACIAVRNRRNLLAAHIRETGGKIMSLAAGPASEIFDALEASNHGSTASFLALDHDIETLKDVAKSSDSHNRITYGIINAFHLIKGKSTYLIPKKSYLHRCNPTTDLKGLNAALLPFKYRIRRLKKESFNLVYTAGLYDYIKTFDTHKKGTVALTHRLFELVKPEVN